MKTYYAAAELAGLPGMQGTSRGVQKAAKREQWVFKEEPSRGRNGARQLFHIDSLPEETRRHLALNRGVVKATYETPAPVKPLVAVETGASVETISASGGTLAPANEADGGDSIYMEPAEVEGAPVSEVKIDPKGEARNAVAVWRMSIIGPAIRQPKHSPARTAEVRAIAARDHVKPDGRTVRVGEKTVSRWIRLYEQAGVLGLRPKPRSDRETRRVEVTRRWDTACPWSADDERRQQVGALLVRFVRSAWASGGAGWKAISDMATVALVKITREAGWDLSEATALDICYVNRRRVEHERQYALLAVEEKDAKRWFDAHVPRIRRDWSGFAPMDLVVGDVHPIDIGVRRADGTVAYPRAIAWQDVATNRVWLTLVLLSPREGVRRVHVAQSFASMSAQWGMPKRLYLDNGSEYNWAEMLNGFVELARLSGNLSVHLMEEDHEIADGVKAIRQAVTRAKPYNAPAKPIEGVFGNLERGPFSMLTGWVGGDRMRKKTANVGQEPEPFAGTWEEFHGAIETGLAYYHARQQSGHLAGKSPREALGQWIADGWGKTGVDYETLALAFAAEDVRKVDRGVVTFANLPFYSDALLHPNYAGRRLVVRYSELLPDRAFVFDGARLAAVAPLDPSFGALDRKGAKEASRRAGVLRRYVADVRRDCDRLDLQEQMAAVEQSRPAMPIPPEHGRISAALVSDELEQMQGADPAALPDGGNDDFAERFARAMGD